MTFEFGRLGRQLAVAAQLAVAVGTLCAFGSAAAKASTLTISFAGTTVAIADAGIGLGSSDLSPLGTAVSGTMTIEAEDLPVISMGNGTTIYQVFASLAGKASSYTFHIDGVGDYGESAPGYVANASNYSNLTGLAYQLIGSTALELGFVTGSPSGSLTDYVVGHLYSLPTTLAEMKTFVGNFDSLFGNFAFGLFLDYANGAGSYFKLTEFSSVYTAGPTAVTPIPAALPLFASALGGLGLVGWRKRRAGGVARAA
jgi:hypothetical protein